MTRWDIDYAEALGVVRKAAAEAAGYEGDLKGVETAVTGLNGVLAHSQLVQASVSGFATEVAAPELTTVAGHTDSAVRGTATAVQAYHAGQEEMAAQAQGNAAKAAYPEDMPGGAAYAANHTGTGGR